MHWLADVQPLDRYKTHFIELVIDKLIPSHEDYKRISDSVEQALEQGKGTLAIMDFQSNDDLLAKVAREGAEAAAASAEQTIREVREIIGFRN